MFTYANETVSNVSQLNPLDLGMKYKGISIHQEGNGYILMLLG